MLHLSATRGAPAAAARTQQSKQRQGQQRHLAVSASRPSSALATAAPALALPRHVPPRRLEVAAVAAVAAAAAAAAPHPPHSPTPTRARPVGRRAASAAPRARTPLLPPLAAKPRDEAEIAKIKADADRDDPWSGDVAERLVKVGLVVAAGAAVATLLSLAQPLISNTVGSFPSA
jgi:hypothetical protein